MKRIVITLSLALLCALSAIAAEKMSVPTAGFDHFAVTKGRNIFDPERRAMRTTENTATQTSGTPPRPDQLALTGTMVTPGRALAFFTGSKSEFNRVIPVNEKLGDCTLVAIGTTQVELERGGKPITLEVGKQITFDNGGNISIGSPTNNFPSASTPSVGPGGSSSTSSSGASAPPSGDKAEILRRMMERREKEMSK